MTNSGGLVGAIDLGGTKILPLVLDERGEVRGELPTGRSDLLRCTVDLGETGNWYLGQRRQDVVSLEYHSHETSVPCHMS